ncbi:hypothetical protein VTJ83DRAFT_4937 [Remersonia thermophila]|uniref:DUF221-domain-containing protein n=1 Tax=Remersonia thermophila TaxID=72144 RepID=A0ABR4DC43_9PEZI
MSQSPAAPSTTSQAPLPAEGAGLAQGSTGVSLISFLTALGSAVVVCGIQLGIFLFLRNKIPRIYKPKTYLVPERERTPPPPSNAIGLLYRLLRFDDRDLIKKCGLDAYFYLRYLQTLLVIFVPIASVTVPVLIPLNYVGGLGQELLNDTAGAGAKGRSANAPKGLDTLAWGNIPPEEQHRRWAHLGVALGVIVWVCVIFFVELRVYVKVRQDYLTSPEHRLRASATTVLVSSIPDKWLSEDALRGLFDVFPGGIRNIWLVRDFTPLLSKVKKRNKVLRQLEAAETKLVCLAKRNQMRGGTGGILQRLNPFGGAKRLKRNRAVDKAARKRASEPGGVRANVPRRHADSTVPYAPSLPTSSSSVSSGSGGTASCRTTDMSGMIVTNKTWFLQFWRPPAGSYASPVPQGTAWGRHGKPHKTTFWQLLKRSLPGFKTKAPKVGYPPAASRDYRDELDVDADAEWRKWVSPQERPRHRVKPRWMPAFVPALPLLSKRVDTIYWCRSELARLNLEIADDQRHPERYPLIGTAFIQFHHQMAAHMACQSVSHHLPKNMAPRMVEISPQDVLWGNMALPWFTIWMRRALVVVVVSAMVVLWAFPVAWTASLAQVDALVRQYGFVRRLLKNSTTLDRIVKAVAGVLPSLVLSVLLWFVPRFFGLLADFQGSKTGAQKSEMVQTYYFAFLFVQVFLVVSITSGTLQTLSSLSQNIASTPSLLAENLPKAANYFFAYMILQALSTSSATLLQTRTLLRWFILWRLGDHSTARAQWARNMRLNRVRWGSFFPTYTNIACIALIYSVVAPLISLFAIVTWAMLWLSHRHNMLYVTRFRTDTGGVLYPRAIHQTFVGLYVMELLLIGLFFLAQDEKGGRACFWQGIIMIVAFVATVIYQLVLSSCFGPLLRYLPITLEDEAAQRDLIFRRAQARRFGLPVDFDFADEATRMSNNEPGPSASASPNHSHNPNPNRNFNPANATITPAAAVAVDNDDDEKQRRSKSTRPPRFQPPAPLRTATLAAVHYRRQRRQRDLEAQRAMGDAFFGGLCDSIEDLAPNEREALVRQAFQHEALRARPPVVWIPRDDLGVGDDEVRRMAGFSAWLAASDEGTALDSRANVVCGRSPPDLWEGDLICL